MSIVYRINTKTKAITSEEFKKEYQLLGNRGLTAKVLTEEVNPQCSPLGAENKLVVCTGILAGTSLSTANRTSFGGKSPLTGGIKESNVGGNLGTFLTQHGIKMFIIEDLPADDQWYYVKIDSESKVTLVSAAEYIGLNTYDFVEKMHELYGKGISVAAIGAAGERQYKIASVMVTDNGTGHPSRAAGRGGLGAVMGSKQIKGFVIEKSATKHEYTYKDKAKFNANWKESVTAVTSHPAVKGFTAAGTNCLTEMTAAMNVLPVRNFSGENFPPERLENLSVDTILSTMSKNGGKQGVGCQAGCIVKCSNIWNNSKGEYVTGGLEYETVALAGPNCDINDFDYLAEVDRICDDLGVDSIEIGNILAVCMDAGKIPWGDKEAAKSLLHEMLQGTDFGNLLGQGTASVGIALGAKRIPVAKGQAFAAYDPRNLKGIGVTYATATMGADHTAGNTIASPPGVNHSVKEGQVKPSADMQIGQCVVDNIGCMMCIPFAMDKLPEIFAGCFGGDWDMDKIIGIGVQTLQMERAFNKTAGFTAEDDKLPDFFFNEPAASGNLYDITTDEYANAFPF